MWIVRFSHGLIGDTYYSSTGTVHLVFFTDVVLGVGYIKCLSDTQY